MFTQWRLMLKLIPTALAITFILQGNLSGENPLALAQTMPQKLETSLSNSTEGQPSELETVSKEEALGVVRYRPKLKPLHQRPQKTSWSQVTDVSQLQDVEPGQWAYEALRGLVERYGCVVGYPDQTFRGNQALSRWEFAAGLNACVNTTERLLQENVAVLREDIEKLKRLSREFEAELAALGSRVDNLEVRTAYLEDHQFSTTTRLNGVITFSGFAYGSGEGDKETVMQNVNYLQLSTSFTGRDLLNTSLLTSNSNLPQLATTNNGRQVGFTNEGFTIWSYGGSLINDLFIGPIEYIFPIIDNGVDRWYLTVASNDGFNTSRFLLPSGDLTWEGFEIGSGPLSAFGQRSPMYRLGGGRGLITNYDRGPWRFTVAYLTSEGEDPSQKAGLFNGDMLALAQLNYTPSESVAIAVNYFHNYFSPGRFAFNNNYKFPGQFGAETPGYVGTALANRFDNAGVFFEENIPVASNSVGVQSFYRISEQIIFGGFASKINARLIGKGDADIWTYAGSFAFPDLFGEGHLGGLIIGMEPTLTKLKALGIDSGSFKRDTSLHIEAYYEYQVNDNIAVTPGFMWITAPNQDHDNEDLFVGLLRTTFSF